MTRAVIEHPSRPLLQVALDTFDLSSALGPLQKSIEHVDVIEVGTILCLSEGMSAVRAISALYPRKPVLADVRIVEAGKIIASLAFESGAGLVSVVSGASDTTVKQVCTVAQRFGGQVQVEIGQYYSDERAKVWHDLGVSHVIVKRSRDAEGTSGDSAWTEDSFEQTKYLADLGFMVTVTGGIRVDTLAQFSGLPVSIFIAGRAIIGADCPSSAASSFQKEIGELWR